MSDPWIVLLVLAGGVHDPADEALVGAARDALANAVVLVDDTPQVLADEDALSLGERVHARAVVRVVWDEDKATARLDVHVGPAAGGASTDAFSHDAIRFDPADAPVERGRTVGFALASMVQRLEAERAPPPASPPPASPTPPAPPDLRGSLEHPEPPPGRVTFAAFGGGSATWNGAATAFGGAAGVRFAPLERLVLRAVVGARFGSATEAAARTDVLVGGLGLAVPVVHHGRFALEARADMLVLCQQATRAYPSGDVSLSRWLGGTDGALEASVSLGRRLDITASGGVEVAFGATEVNVGGQGRAEIPAFRGLSEVGVRVGF